MTKQVINVGTLPNDGTGDTLLSAMNKINANFTDLYTTSYSSNVVNSFNTRTGAVTLLNTDVTGALTYTPANKAGDTFTGLVVLNNGFVSGQSGAFDLNAAGIGILPAAPTGTIVRAINADTTQSIISLDSFINAGGTMSAIVLRGSRGLGSAPTAIQSTDVIGQVSAAGYGASQFNAATSGQINFVAEGNFTNSSTPTAIAFQVTAVSSATPSELMRLTSLGNLILNGTGALQLPVGNTGQQPSPSVQGMVRYNTTTSRFEFYNGATWVNHVKVSGDTMTGTLTAPALVGTNGASTLDSFIIGSITPSSATFTAINATSIGGTTAGTGAFTALSASSTVSGTGFSTYLASPPAIGGTAPAAGNFTSVQGTSFAGPGTGYSIVTVTGLSSGGGIQLFDGSNGSKVNITNAGSAVAVFTSTGINSAAIGATTASTGAFTTLSASSTVSGTGFSTYLASPPAIGSTAANTGSFTALSSTGNFTPSQTNGIVGTTTNNNANAGSVGEHVTATGTAVSLTNNTFANITSISLTAGDWEVYGSAAFNPAASTTMSAITLGINSTSATLPANGLSSQLQCSFTTGTNQGMVAPSQRFSLSATTTIYLVTIVSFGASTMTTTGIIRARRVR